jgi:hypothetical protein
MKLGFGKRQQTGFCSPDPTGQPSDEDQWHRSTGPLEAQAKRRNPGPGPGCSLGAGEAVSRHGPRLLSGRKHRHALLGHGMRFLLQAGFYSGRAK